LPFLKAISTLQISICKNLTSPVSIKIFIKI
jgi:hypothetical protein